MKPGPNNMHDHFRVCLNIKQQYPHRVGHFDGIARTTPLDLRGLDLPALVSQSRLGIMPKYPGYFVLLPSLRLPFPYEIFIELGNNH